MSGFKINLNILSVGPVQNRTFWEFGPQLGTPCINMGQGSFCNMGDFRAEIELIFCNL